MKKNYKQKCRTCNGTGWQEIAEEDDGTACYDVCVPCEGYGRRELTPDEIEEDFEAERLLTRMMA